MTNNRPRAIAWVLGLGFCAASTPTFAQQACPSNLEQQLVNMSGPVIAMSKGANTSDDTMTIQDQKTGCRILIDWMDMVDDPMDSQHDVCPVGTSVVANGGVLLRADHQSEHANDGTFDYAWSTHDGQSVTKCPLRGGLSWDEEGARQCVESASTKAKRFPGRLWRAPRWCAWCRPLQMRASLCSATA